MAGPNLILLRHGESAWNQENRFTGWADIDLTEEGVLQVTQAAEAIHAAGLEFDIACTSVLRRCIRSQWILLDRLDRMWVPQLTDWRLNERHYGALTGHQRSEMARIHGPEAVRQWRRGYDAAPPATDAAAAAWVPLDARYAGLALGDFPTGESLHHTVLRVTKVWNDVIVPQLQSGQRVLVTVHGNVLRALMKIIEGLSDHDVTLVEVPNSVPIVYELDSALAVLAKRELPVPPRRPSYIL